MLLSLLLHGRGLISFMITVHCRGLVYFMTPSPCPGVIVAATLSCSLGCSGGGGGFGEAYATEQRLVIEWAQRLAAAPPADMPWAETLDFTYGAAVAGHSMGGNALGQAVLTVTIKSHAPWFE